MTKTQRVRTGAHKCHHCKITFNTAAGRKHYHPHHAHHHKAR